MKIPLHISPKNPILFSCIYCNYNTVYSKDYTKHLLTRKHQILQNPTSNVLNSKIYTCKCGKQYKHSSTLYAHKNICDYNKEEPTDKELMMIILKDNSDIKHLMLEIVKNGTNNTTNNNNTINTNSHNKAFNLNLFLNETCKNAMNITDFVDSIKLELSDLMELGEIGYVASMSKIITKNLNALDETIRPIHCTDSKRETFYIKDEDKWEKEDEEMKRLRKLIFRLSNKTYKLMPKYREKYPDYNNAESIHSDKHCKIIIEAMICDNAKDNKIIRNISKITTITAK